MTAHLQSADADQPILSVIIPCLNEAATLPLLLQDLDRQRHIDLDVLVADGGSTDESPEQARRFGARLIQAGRGRGAQMNKAAGQARGDWLLFLHADSRINDEQLLADALRTLRQAQTTADDKRIAGHFRLHFDRQRPHHQRLLFRYMEAKTALNRPYCVNGDQGMLLHRDYFQELGRFDESLPFLEDLRLAERVTHKGRATGHWITLPGKLTTSARRFETEGAGRYLLMAFIVIAEAADIPEFIAQSPRLYQSQDATGRLLLTPYFRLFADIARQRGLHGTWQALLNIGHLSRLHWWQLFFLLDVTFRLKRQPVLWFYDHVVHPLTANRLGDAITAAMGWVFGMWLLRPYFRLREHQALKGLQHD